MRHRKPIGSLQKIWGKCSGAFPPSVLLCCCRRLNASLPTSMILFVFQSIRGQFNGLLVGSFLNLVLSVSLYECQSKVLWKVFVTEGMCGMWVKRRRGYIMQTQSSHSYFSNSLGSNTIAVWAIFPTMIMLTFGLKCRSDEINWHV